MTAREVEIINETEIFAEALVASIGLGAITVDQLKRQIEDGRAYVEARGSDNVAEELLVALAALDKAIQRVTGAIHNLGVDRFLAVDAPSLRSNGVAPLRDF